MHSLVILATAMAALAAANPLDKRAYYTEVATVTVWTTVTAGLAEKSPTPDPSEQAQPRLGEVDDTVQVEDTASKEPDVAQVTPKPAEPETEPVEPETEPVEPETEPVEPETEPVEPEIEPVEPETEPVEPDTEPAAPVESGTKPNESAEPQAKDQSQPGVFAEQGSSESSYSPDASNKDYTKEMLDAHNVHRANHSNTASLTWSNKLAATAEKQIQICEMIHDMKVDESQYETAGSNPYGQNIGFNSDFDATTPIHLMYNKEIVDHIGMFDGDSLSPESVPADHYTQMVWQETTEVGCASRRCGKVDYMDDKTNTRKTAEMDGGLLLTFCNYSPPGNMQGQFQNVGSPIGDATVGPSGNE